MSGFAPPKPDQPDSSHTHRHQLELAGYNALLAEHCELVDRVTGLQQRIVELEALMQRLGLADLADDEMLMIGHRSSPKLWNDDQLIIAELGNGWQIVRTETTDGH